MHIQTQHFLVHHHNVHITSIFLINCLSPIIWHHISDSLILFLGFFQSMWMKLGSVHGTWTMRQQHRDMKWGGYLATAACWYSPIYEKIKICIEVLKLHGNDLDDSIISISLYMRYLKLHTLMPYAGWTSNISALWIFQTLNFTLTNMMPHLGGSNLSKKYMHSSLIISLQLHK